MTDSSVPGLAHSHVFLGRTHRKSERKTWAVIGLCAAMMALEIVGGWAFGSIALVADGLHMSTHAGALLLAALAYTYARKYADDRRFSFGTGKFGDLAGFASAIVLAMIALLIGFEALVRLFAPITIDFGQAIPIAGLGLAVNVASAWLLSSGDDHDHGHSHGHSHGHADAATHDGHHEAVRRIETGLGPCDVEVFENGVPPRFRVRVQGAGTLLGASVETVRPDGTRTLFALVDRGDYLESVDEIPEPHAFTANLRIGDETHAVVFQEHHDGDVKSASHRDNNMRAAVIHVAADAAVSLLVIAGLLLARAFGWAWMDPVAGIVGALVIASWSYGLVRDTGAILLDVNPELKLADTMRRTLEDDGDKVADLHLWRLGPGHLGAIVSILTARAREADYYRRRLSGLRFLSHLTIEVARR